MATINEVLIWNHGLRHIDEMNWGHGLYKLYARINSLYVLVNIYGYLLEPINHVFLPCVTIIHFCDPDAPKISHDPSIHNRQ